MEVTGADGRVWTVRRRPGRKPRWRRFGRSLDPLDMLEVGSAGLDSSISGALVGIALGILIIVGLAIFIFVLLPAILFLGEVILVGLGVVTLIGGWRVEAVTIGPPEELRSWPVRGWFRSRRAVEEVASELRMGVPAAPEGLEP